MENLNRGRTVPGQEGVQAPSVGNKPADMGFVRGLPKKMECPFDKDCRGCRIALNVNGKVECSIAVIAVELLKSGIKLTQENKDVDS